MRKRNLLLLIAAFVFVLAACQKETSNEALNNPAGGSLPPDSIPNQGDTSHGSTGSEAGTWKFVSVSGLLSQTTEFSQAGIAIKAVTTSNFTSQDNGGTITFDSSTMTANGITLAINTTTNTYFYQNNVLLDSLKNPLNQSVPPQNATSGYKKIGADSLNFVDGAFLDALTGGLMPATPTGCKISFSGNIMKMTIAYDTVTTEDYQGIPAKITLHTVLVATLQKS
jgi:hypothetical protein